MSQPSVEFTFDLTCACSTAGVATLTLAQAGWSEGMEFARDQYTCPSCGRLFTFSLQLQVQVEQLNFPNPLKPLSLN